MNRVEIETLYRDTKRNFRAFVTAHPERAFFVGVVLGCFLMLVKGVVFPIVLVCGGLLLVFWILDDESPGIETDTELTAGKASSSSNIDDSANRDEAKQITEVIAYRPVKPTKRPKSESGSDGGSVAGREKGTKTTSKRKAKPRRKASGTSKNQTSARAASGNTKKKSSSKKSGTNKSSTNKKGAAKKATKSKKKGETA